MQVNFVNPMLSIFLVFCNVYLMTMIGFANKDGCIFSGVFTSFESHLGLILGKNLAIDGLSLFRIKGNFDLGL